MGSRSTSMVLLAAAGLTLAVLSGCGSTDYHGPSEAQVGGRGGDMRFPAGVTSSSNNTAGYAGNPPSIKPTVPSVPEVEPPATDAAR